MITMSHFMKSVINVLVSPPSQNSSGDENGTQYIGLTLAATTTTVTIFQIVLMAISIVLSIIVCSGNLLTVIAVKTTPELRTIPNMYIVSLAFADFFTGVSFPFNLAASLHHLKDELNNSRIKCTIRYGFLHIFLSESFLCILAIAIDRFLYVMYPLRYHVYVSPKKTGFAILTSWVVSISIGACMVLTSGWKGKCRFFKVVSGKFYLGFVVPYMCAIFLVVAYLYARITRLAFKQRRRVRCEDMTNGYKLRYASTFRSLRLFVMVYGVFVLCWFPAGVVAMIGYVSSVSINATDVTLSIGFLNSGVNFIVYVATNKDFRKAFNVILKCPVSNGHRPNINHVMN